MSWTQSCGVVASLVLTSVASSAAEPLPLDKRGALRVLVYPEMARLEFYIAGGGDKPGFEREILEGLIRVEKVRLETVTVADWEDLVPQLLEGKGDLIAGHFTETPDRRKQVAFSKGLLPTRSTVVTRKPNPPVTTVGQLRALKKIGVVKGTAAVESLAAAGIPPAQIDDSLTLETMLDALRSGKVQALVRSVPLAVLSQRDDAEIQIGMFLGPPSHFAFGVRKDDGVLRAALDRHIDLLRRTGQWNRLVMKYFGADAVEILKKAE